MRRSRRGTLFPLASGALALALYGCGGGGGGGGTPAPPDPPAPAPPAGGSGCSVAVTPGPFATAWPGAEWRSATPQSQGLCPDAINRALDYAFDDDNFTGAVLIARNGLLVAEQYADDRDKDSLATSWSVAKSVTSALVGAAVDDGLLANLDEETVVSFLPDAHAATWRESAKADITVRQLLTLRTALRTVNAGALYAAADQLAFSVDRGLVGTPGEKHYSYSNADVMLAGQVVATATGMAAQHYLGQRIGAAIGFTGEWWEDSVGHVLTYCCLDATPRDFARFGLLFARRGAWQGAQVVSADWWAASTAPALDGEYGYYWWPAEPDGFAAIGLSSQLLAIYPDDDLVVARFSRYTRLGDGVAVRARGNRHHTEAPQDFENEAFLERVRAALPAGSR